jgi:glucokinase
VEAYVGLNGILRIIKDRLESGKESILKKIGPDKITPKEISYAAGNGDSVAIEVFRQVGEYLGVGLGNVVNLLNLERIVVGGGVSKAGEFILGPARETFSKTALKVCLDAVNIVPATFIDRAGIVGAARLAMLNGT